MPVWPAGLGTRRQLAGVAAAAVLAAGGITTWAVMPSSSSAGQDGTYLAPPPVPWAPQAQVALASFDHQLSLTQSALGQWNAVPAALRPATPPPAVIALQQRQAVLQSQRDTLASQLASAQALAQTNSTLATATSNLARLQADEKTTTPTSTGVAPSRPGPQVNAALASQEQTLQTQIGMLHSQAAALDRDVKAAQASPLPAATDSTTPLAEQVVGLAEHPPPREPVGTNPNGQNPVVAGRGGASAASAAASAPAATAPPRPGDGGTTGPIDAAAAGSGAGSGGPGVVGAVGGAVGSLLDPGASAPDTTHGNAAAAGATTRQPAAPRTTAAVGRWPRSEVPSGRSSTPAPPGPTRATATAAAATRRGGGRGAADRGGGGPVAAVGDAVGSVLDPGSASTDPAPAQTQHAATGAATDTTPGAVADHAGGHHGVGAAVGSLLNPSHDSGAAGTSGPVELTTRPRLQLVVMR